MALLPDFEALRTVEFRLIKGTFPVADSLILVQCDNAGHEVFRARQATGQLMWGSLATGTVDDFVHSKYSWKAYVL